MRGVGCLVVLLAGCGAATPTPVQPLPKDEVVVAPAAPPPRDWFVERVPLAAVGRSHLSVHDGTTIVFTHGTTIGKLQRGARGWTVEHVGEGTSPNARRADGREGVWTLEPGAAPLSAWNDEDSRPVEIGPANVTKADIATDRRGGVHVCFVDPTGVSYVVRDAVSKIWSTYKVPDANASNVCAVSAEADGTAHVVHAANQGPARDVRSNIATRDASGNWSTAPAPEKGSPVVRTSATGEPVIALAGEKEVRLVRRDPKTKTWGVSPSVLVGPDRIVEVALALDGAGHASVAAVLESGAVGLAREGADPKWTPIANVDKGHELVLEIDKTGQEHLVFLDDTDLTYARPRREGDPREEGIALDRNGVLDACVRHLDRQLGALRPAEALLLVEVDAARCVLGKHSATFAPWLRSSCEQEGDARACFVAGALATPPKAVGRIRTSMRWVPCTANSTGVGKRCVTVIDEREDLVFASFEPDAALATRLYARACELGHVEACVGRAQMGAAAKDDADFLHKACTNGIPRACLLYLSRVQVQKISTSTKGDVLAEILPIIEAACGQEDPDACNVAAFVEESKSDTAAAGYAEAAQLKACGLGSGASCTRIIARGGKRPPPPSELVGPNLERMLGEMRRGCQRGDEEACLALVSLFETNWAVTSTPDDVKKLLEELCDGGLSAKACARIGKPAPKKKT